MNKKVLLEEIKRIQEVMYSNNRQILTESIIPFNPIKGLDDLKKIFWSTRSVDLVSLVDDFAKSTDNLADGSLSKSFMEGVERSASYADEALDAFIELESALKNGTAMSEKTLDLLYRGLLKSPVFVDEVVELTLKDAGIIEKFVKNTDILDDWKAIQGLGDDAIKEFKDGLKRIINGEVDLPNEISDKLLSLVDETYSVTSKIENIYKTMTVAELKNLWSNKSVEIGKKSMKSLTEDDKFLLEALVENGIISTSQHRGLLNSLLPGWRDIYAAKTAYEKSGAQGTFKDYFFDKYIPSQNLTKEQYLSKAMPWYSSSVANLFWDTVALTNFKNPRWLADTTRWLFQHLIVKGGVPMCMLLAGPIDCTKTILDLFDNISTAVAEMAQKSNLSEYGGNILTYIDKFIEDPSQDLEIMIPNTDVVEEKSFNDVEPPIISGYDMVVVKQDGNDYLLEFNVPRTYDYNGTTINYNYAMFEMAQIEDLASNFYLLPEDKILDNFPSFKEFSDFNDKNEQHIILKTKWAEQNMTPPWDSLTKVQISISGNKLKFVDDKNNKMEYIIDLDGVFKPLKGKKKDESSIVTASYENSPAGFIKWANTEKGKEWSVDNVSKIEDIKDADGNTYPRYSYNGVEFIYKDGTFKID